MEQDFRIISYVDSKFTPHTIARINHDLKSEEYFSLGDMVTNSHGMRGTIQQFSLHEGTVFVTTDWSGVGMSLDQVERVILLPAEHQINDQVLLSMNQSDYQRDGIGNGQVYECKVKANVIGVHFYRGGKIKYDLDIQMSDKPPTRVYNIDASVIQTIR